MTTSRSPLLRSFDLRPGEGAALTWSAAYFFLVLTSYYIMRPIRDNFGAIDGVDNLAWLFTGTLAGVLLLHPLYASLVARFPRQTFIAWTYRFFFLNLGIFFLLLQSGEMATNLWVGRTFFIWLSVFNLFVVSVFWSFMNDLYRPRQAKRLFGVIAVGGTLGATFGSAITSLLSNWFSAAALLLVAGALLELAVWASRAAAARSGELAVAAAADGDGAVARQDSGEVVGGGTMDGIRDVLKSPYLLGIALLMLFFTISSTFIYFFQADLSRAHFGDDSAGRTQFFANRDLVVNVLTFGLQLFATGRILKAIGVGAGLAILPIASIVGFTVLGLTPTLMMVVGLDVIRRVGNFAIQRPARELLYSVLSRSEKYKAKNFNDTFVYRLGDQLGAWGYAGLTKLGLALTGLAFVMLPIAAMWAVLAFWLGRQQANRERMTESG